MSEVEQTNPLENMIDFAANAEFNKANDVFNDVLMSKVHHALEQEKVAVAQGIWQDAIDDEITDEDLEDAAEDHYEENDEDE